MRDEFVDSSCGAVTETSLISSQTYVALFSPERDTLCVASSGMTYIAYRPPSELPPCAPKCSRSITVHYANGGFAPILL